jgi:parallel beta-helix repeat protein/predicted outer membrane repeat protein
MYYLKACLTIAAVLVATSMCLATKIHIPADQPTIQAGIDTAVNGDTVLVADGIYTGDGNRDIDFLGKDIVVMSESGPSSCIIDCEGDSLNLHRAFYFHNGETSGSGVQGFTIQNGYGSAINCDISTSPTISNSIFTDNSVGHAIYCNDDSSPTISNNTFIENSDGAIYCNDYSSPTISNNTFVENSGGAIYCGSSSTTISNNTFTGNSGGAIVCSWASPTISNNTFTGNSVPDYGGAIYCGYYSSPIISDNTFKENSAYVHYGGAIYCEYDSNPIISDNTFTANFGNYRGGAIHCESSSPNISNNTFTGNYAGWDGGAICCFSSNPTISNNTFIANSACFLGFGYSGGAIYCDDSDLNISNNIFMENYAYESGGAICCAYSSSPTIAKNIFAENSAGYYGGGAIYCRYCTSPTISKNTFTANYAGQYGGGAIRSRDSNPTIKNCILWGDIPDEIVGSVIVAYSDVMGGWVGEGNIDEDPLFILPDKDDCRLLWGSPCIDSGDPTLFDADGTRSDMGAHYFNQNDYLTLYVTPDKLWTRPGQQFGVTYTAINRWDSAEPFWVLSRVLLPGGSALNILGPDLYTLPANYTAQVHITHPVPNATPTGVYRYLSAIGVPPSTLYDWDSFKFWVIE